MRKAPELWISLALMLALGAAYAFALPSTARAPGGGVGHPLGIIGVALMFGAEILYSIRKRAKDVAWGPMRTWLRVHVIAGLVGPFLIALHSAGHLHGVGGWAAIATAIVVASGFTGRYLYTAIPRAATGVELSPKEIEAQLSSAELRLADASLDDRARKDLTRMSGRLRRRATAADGMRRLLARWHTFHVPLSLALFTLVVIHIVVAIYYGAGMR
jgi:hypothetical protein